MSISFRFARPDEIEDVVRLTSHSFPGVGRTPENWVERFNESPFGDGPEIIWVGEEGGRLVASCQLHRIVHWVAGAEVPAMGLGTVAIAPTHRQQGIAGRMVETALHAARERGDVISSLYPFRMSFYGRYGYGLAGDVHQYHVPPSAFPADEARHRVEIVHAGPVLGEIGDFYAVWGRTQTGQVKRSERSWADLSGAPDRLLVAYREADGRIGGYALAAYPVQLPPEERYLSVDELAWATPEARRGLYGWLATLGDQWRGVAIRALPEHRVEDWLREPRLSSGRVPAWGLWFPSAALLRGPMFRVLDLPRAWSGRRIHPVGELTLALEVQDEHLPENAGVWRLRLEGDRVDVSAGEAAADVKLRIGIQALARMYLGSLLPGEAVAAGLAQVDRPERLGTLDEALRLPQAWTFDRY